MRRQSVRRRYREVGEYGSEKRDFLRRRSRERTLSANPLQKKKAGEENDNGNPKMGVGEDGRQAIAPER